MEIWKDIQGYEGLYQISNLGRIKNKHNKILKLSNKRWKKESCPQNDYKKIRLSKNGKSKGFSVHRLVAREFLNDYDKKLEVNHKDGNKSNNKVSNLEMISHRENIKHSYEVLNKIRVKKKRVVSRNKKGEIIFFESQADAIRYLRQIGYIKATHSGVSYAIKNKTMAYDHRWNIR